MNKSIIKSALAITLALASAGCGKQAFVVAEQSAESVGPGFTYIPPKVDILLAEDDTGSIYAAYNQIKVQMPAFLTNLQTKGWDFHFATTPLTTERALNQLMASRHDANWGSQWTAPFPGALITGPGSVNSAFFRKPENYTHFITTSDVSNASGGMEPGFETIKRALTTHAAGTGFLRDDAMLVIITLGNGEDTSGVTYCTRTDGFRAPCEDLGKPGGTKASSFESYKAAFQGVKANPAQAKFFSLVSTANRSSCLGGGAYAGNRYIQMAAAMGGASFDVCTNSISSVLNGVASHLTQTRLDFRTRFLMLNGEPDESSIVVTKYIGGDLSNTVTIPHDPINGWTYAGEIVDEYLIDFPVPMNKASGFAVELHGSAKLLGEDRAKVSFNPAGAVSSVTQ